MDARCAFSRALLTMGAAVVLGPGLADAQDFSRPPLDPPPAAAGGSSSDLNRAYILQKARQAAARGAKLPKGVIPDGNGNVVVLGSLKGDITLVPTFKQGGGK